MIGDKIVVKEHHTRAAEGAYKRIKETIDISQKIAITVAGESGSGKSEVASEIARLFKQNEGYDYYIFAQDDYFRLPPKTNDKNRRNDISQVGESEVRLELLNNHLESAKSSDATVIVKPLMDYELNQELTEEVKIKAHVIIAEGTYTTTLSSADIHVFIDRTYEDTLAHRLERGRDIIDDFADNVLKIEHDIISKHKSAADIIISREYEVV